MKQLEEERIDQLLGIITLYPAIRIMHFSDGSQLLTQKINTLCEQHDYDYQLNCTTDACYEEMEQRYSNADMIKIKRFDLNRPRYAIQAKLYDYLFVTAQIPDEEKLSFLKKTYSVIKNAGHILIFLSRDDLHQNHIWSELLLENNFVASNTLDIFMHYDVIIAKKMHGWGG